MRLNNVAFEEAMPGCSAKTPPCCMLTWHLCSALVYMCNSLRILAGWRKPLKETRTACSVCVCLCLAADLLYSHHHDHLHHLPRGFKKSYSSSFSALVARIYVYKSSHRSRLLLFAFYTKPQSEETHTYLTSSHSYFPAERRRESRVNESSPCAKSCSVLLWIRLFFNDVRCHKINIPLCAQTMCYKWERVHVHKYTHVHKKYTLVQKPYSLLVQDCSPVMTHFIWRMKWK